jgi:hypothetical protein
MFFYFILFFFPSVWSTSLLEGPHEGSVLPNEGKPSNQAIGLPLLNDPSRRIGCEIFLLAWSMLPVSERAREKATLIPE